MIAQNKPDSFDYLATVVLAPVAIVAKADAPYDTMAQFVAYAKEHDGGLVSFDAKPQELILRAADAGFAAGAHIKYIASGDLKVLAVATETRHAYAPELTTLIEQGFDYSTEPYFYFAASPGLIDDAKAALEKALDDSIMSDAVSGMIQNTMTTVPTNLGAQGTYDNLTSGLGIIFFGSLILLFWIMPQQVETVDYGRVFPATVPSIALSIIIACSGVQIFAPTQRGGIDIYTTLRTLLFIALIVLAVHFMGVIGFEYCAPLLALLVMLLIGERRWYWLATGTILVPIGVWPWRVERHRSN